MLLLISVRIVIVQLFMMWIRSVNSVGFIGMTLYKYCQSTSTTMKRKKAV